MELVALSPAHVALGYTARRGAIHQEVDGMTYTIIGRCPRTRQLGVGIATFSLAIGGYCPYVKADLGAVSSQASADPDWANQDRSAALIVFEREEYALMDLRVDSHVAAIQELRRLRDEYSPYVPWYYKLRIEQPDKGPRHTEFLGQLKEA